MEMEHGWRSVYTISFLRYVSQVLSSHRTNIWLQIAVLGIRVYVTLDFVNALKQIHAIAMIMQFKKTNSFVLKILLIKS